MLSIKVMERVYDKCGCIWGCGEDHLCWGKWIMGMREAVIGSKTIAKKCKPAINCLPQIRGLAVIGLGANFGRQ